MIIIESLEENKSIIIIISGNMVAGYITEPMIELNQIGLDRIELNRIGLD